MTNALTMERIIEHHLLYKDKERLKGGKIGPSEISSPCARQVVLGRSAEAVSEAEEPTLRSIGVMLVGTAIHEYFQEKVFKENGRIEIIEAEKFISSDCVNGYIDGVIRFTDQNTLALLEIKSVNQAKYDKMKSSGKPLPEYVEQLTLYEGEEGIHTGYIFVINRGLFEHETPVTRALKPTDGIDDGMFLVFEVTFDSNLYNSLVDRARGLMRTLDDFREYGIVPEKPGSCSPNGFPCLWCRFKQYCWPGMYREIPIGELDPSTKAELGRLFAEHMANRAKIQALSLKIQASEKALNKFFRDNGKKGFSSVIGDTYVIGTDGGLYIEKISEHRKRRETRQSLAVSPELITVSPRGREEGTQLTLTGEPDTKAARGNKTGNKKAAEKTAKPRKANKQKKCDIKTPPDKRAEAAKETAIPTEEEYINDIFAGLDF
jgi:hypothetical protein